MRKRERKEKKIIIVIREEKQNKIKKNKEKTYKTKKMLGFKNNYTNRRHCGILIIRNNLQVSWGKTILILTRENY